MGQFAFSIPNLSVSDSLRRFNGPDGRSRRAARNDVRRNIFRSNRVGRHNGSVPNGNAVLILKAATAGKALALTDKDFKAGWSIVSKDVYCDNNQPRITAPKTDSGTRKAPIPDRLRPQLLKHL